MGIDATFRSLHNYLLRGNKLLLPFCAPGTVADPNVSRFNGKSLSGEPLVKTYDFTDLEGRQPDAWRYVAEVHEAGKPADVTGYR